MKFLWHLMFVAKIPVTLVFGSVIYPCVTVTAVLGWKQQSLLSVAQTEQELKGNCRFCRGTRESSSPHTGNMPKPPLRGCPRESPVVLALNTSTTAARRSCVLWAHWGLDTEAPPLLRMEIGASAMMLPKLGFLKAPSSVAFCQTEVLCECLYGLA